MVHVLSMEQVESLIYRSVEGDILVIGGLSWYHESDFVTTGWVQFNTKSLYTDRDLIFKIIKYQGDHVWWLH